MFAYCTLYVVTDVFMSFAHGHYTAMVTAEALQGGTDCKGRQ